MDGFLPQLDGITDLWLIMLILTGVCAIAGIVLITITRANKR